jgi:hypothetical protein
MDAASPLRLESDLLGIHASLAKIRVHRPSVIIVALFGFGIRRIESGLNELERTLQDAEAVVPALFERWNTSGDLDLKRKFGALLDQFHSDLHDGEDSLFQQLVRWRLMRMRLNHVRLLRPHARETINAIFWKTVDVHNHMVRLRILCADVDSRLYPPDIANSARLEKQEAVRHSR